MGSHTPHPLGLPRERVGEWTVLWPGSFSPYLSPNAHASPVLPTAAARREAQGRGLPLNSEGAFTAQTHATLWQADGSTRVTQECGSCLLTQDSHQLHPNGFWGQRRGARSP